ncbi:MAG: hypothetical protein JWP74_523 [Marmoricola sp.]|nr:hypothetical protein [Marmoricola sp.]
MVEPKVRHVWLHGQPHSGLPGKPAFLLGWVREPTRGEWYGQVVTVDEVSTTFQIHWAHADMISDQERVT